MSKKALELEKTCLSWTTIKRQRRLGSLKRSRRWSQGRRGRKYPEESLFLLPGHHTYHCGYIVLFSWWGMDPSCPFQLLYVSAPSHPLSLIQGSYARNFLILQCEFISISKHVTISSILKKKLEFFHLPWNFPSLRVNPLYSSFIPPLYKIPVCLIHQLFPH